MNTDTITAISSGLTTSGIGIVRISGSEALKVAGRISHIKGGLDNASSHTVHFGFVTDCDESRIDEALIIVMKAPHSYTGEDVVEIQCHGGPYIMRQILEACVRAGARLAEPGEFTKRAFLNGRLDLSQAESVMQLIESNSEFARRAALNGLKGVFGKKISSLREKLLYETAYLEAALDDPEHISLDGFDERLLSVVDDEIEKIDALITQAEEGAILREGIKTVILGKPNAGKSTLLNLLSGSSRAIVTEIPGTTRDILEESVRLGQITLRLTDTAGLRQTEDVVEEIGVKRAYEAAETAALIFYILDASGDVSGDKQELKKLKEKYAKACFIIILNKTDITDENQINDIKNLFADEEIVPFSAKEGTGLDALKQRITDLFYSKRLEEDAEIAIANSRQKEALSDARSALIRVREAINAGVPQDLYTVDLTDAYGKLGIITGDSVTEDLINEIFSKFCMGK